MIVKCEICGKRYDDVYRWTFCPHETFQPSASAAVDPGVKAYTAENPDFEPTKGVKYAIIDTETSGLFDFSKPADADGQPRLAELVMITVDEDLVLETEYHAYVKPDGWAMEPGATKVNGLTTEFLTEKGWPVRDVLEAYSDLIVREQCVVVAHNAQYDTKVMRGELRRAGMPDLFEQTPNICTMRSLTDVCQILNNRGSGWKWPKLSEACVHFGIKLLGDHSAMEDAMCVLLLLRKMKELGILPEPQVHYAKNKP